MEPNPSNPTPSTCPVGFLSNEGTERYSLEAKSTTGFVAWKMADGTTLVSEAQQVSLKPSQSVSFWSCAGYQDTTPVGEITYFDCHGNELTKLDVRALTGLEYLDCCFNRLAELPLDGLTEIEALDTNNNQLTGLEVRHLRSLRVLNCASNRLTKLNCSGLDRLQVLDCSGNPGLSPKLDGCTAIQDCKKSKR